MASKLNRVLFFLTTIIFIPSLQAQEILFSNHYFLNPYLINPAMVGNSGYTQFSLNYRQQWAGIEGAPVVSRFVAEMPLNTNLSLGVNISSEKRGVLNTTIGMATLGYNVYFGNKKSAQKRLSFGLSVGMDRTGLDLDQVDNLMDPALANLLGNANMLDGQFGLNFQNNNFKFGFVLPRLFRKDLVSPSAFGEINLEPLKYTHVMMSYRLDLSPSLAFEPWVIYNTNEYLPNQWEAMGLFHIRDLMWAGAAYRQNYGFNFVVGFNIGTKFKMGYSYELPDKNVTQLGQRSHEFHVAFAPNSKDYLEDIRPVNKNNLFAENQEPPKEKVVENEQPIQKEPEPEIMEEPAVSPTKIREPVEVITHEIESYPEETAEIMENEASLDMGPGHYVVVGAFAKLRNAENYLEEVVTEGYPASMHYHEQSGLFHVVVARQNTYTEAVSIWKSIKTKRILEFKNSWVLTIE